MNVRFGHKAVVQLNSSLMIGFGGKADLKNAENQDFEGPESAGRVDRPGEDID